MDQSEQMDRFDLNEAMNSLANTPNTLRDFLANLPDAWLDFKEEPDAWSPRSVLVHFIHNEQINWIVRARVILSFSEDKTFPPFSQMPDEEAFPPMGTSQLLDQFAELRGANLAEMQAFEIGPEDLDREGVHPALGTVNLRQLISTWVVHDFNHLHQIAKSLSKRYGAEVGPWRPNLAIIDL
jgi:hypothetical protein